MGCQREQHRMTERPMLFAIYSHDPRLGKPMLVKRFATAKAAQDYKSNAAPKQKEHWQIERDA